MSNVKIIAPPGSWDGRQAMLAHRVVSGHFQKTPVVWLFASWQIPHPNPSPGGRGVLDSKSAQSIL